MAGSAALAVVLPAHAAREVDDVAQLLEQGQADQAAMRADQFLQLNPQDAEMRFLRGVIASEQKNTAQAIQIFSALARDYPGMPEPYNNLAVLYAAQGQERKAADALEQAIRAQPGYATAHENLGDLYARMASQSYAKALELDGSRQGIAPKQLLMAQLAPGKAGAAEPAAAVPKAAAAAQASAASAASPAPTAPPAVATLTPVQPAAPLPAPTAERISSATPLQLAAADAAKAAASARPAADAAPATVAENASQPADASPAAVEAAVQAWAKAWAAQDMDRYLAAYSPRFKPADGSSLAAWTQSRRQRIEGKRDIHLSLSDLQVAVQGDRATAGFLQAYAAGALKSNARKTLLLQAEQGQWRIVAETVGR